MGATTANPRQLTDQQALAVDTREVSIVLSSGAGCGKTHVLTERYLSHLNEDDVEVGQIAAITFTERAARQMRDRIRRAIRAHLQQAEQEEEAERWSRHLRGLETAPISTIHAFCGTLLRQNAVEAGLDPHFEVLEDVLATCLESEALTTCLQGLLTGEGEGADDLRALILLYGWRPVMETVQHLMRHWHRADWQRWSLNTDQVILDDWQQLASSTLLPRYIDYALSSRRKLNRLIPLLKKHPPEPGPMADNVAILLDEIPQLNQAKNFTEAVERLAEAAKVGKKGAKAWPDPEVYDQIKDAFKDFREDLRGLKLERFDLDVDAMPLALTTARQFLRVAQSAMDTYQERKLQHGVVDFQDMLILARDLLANHDGVRARLQDRYRYLLIDELQDTDPVQMELVEHLCGGRLTAGKLFAVGDHSQSIYRFRGADVHLFQKLRDTMPHEGRLDLTRNFRSQPAILDFTNLLLGHRLTDYEPLVAHHPQTNPEACIEFLWSAANDDDNATQARISEAEGIASRIAKMIGQERLVVENGQLRPVRAGDVVLLFRAMSNVHLYETALRRFGLDYYLVGGRAFYAQQEIYDVLSLLRTLENPQDEVSLAGTLRSPFCCLSDEALFILRYRDGKRRSLWQGLHEPTTIQRAPKSQQQRIQRAAQFLTHWRTLKDRLSIARLLSEIFADSGYDAATQVEFLADRKLANLWKLMELARTFDRSGLFGLADFIQRLNDLVAAQPREEQAATQPENANVVRLMSIHQAKGLEFPVVVLPDIDSATRDSTYPMAHWDAQLGCVVRPPSDEDPPPFADYGWGLWKVQEEIEDWHESLRTFYVACTRAMDYLILSSSMKSYLRPQSVAMKTLMERFDPFTGACLVDVDEETVIPAIKISDREPIVVPEVKNEKVKSTKVNKDWFSIPTSAEVIETVESNTEEQFDAEDGSDQHQWVKK